LRHGFNSFKVSSAVPKSCLLFSMCIALADVGLLVRLYRTCSLCLTAIVISRIVRCMFFYIGQSGRYIADRDGQQRLLHCVRLGQVYCGSDTVVRQNRDMSILLNAEPGLRIRGTVPALIHTLAQSS
jgi:hypothetical protein